MPRHRTPANDPRLDLIPSLIEDKKIVTFGDIFHFFPRTSAAKYLGIDIHTFNKCLLDPYAFTGHQVNKLAVLFDLSREQMQELILRHIREVKKGGWTVPKMDYRGRGAV